MPRHVIAASLLVLAHAASADVIPVGTAPDAPPLPRTDVIGRPLDERANDARARVTMHSAPAADPDLSGRSAGDAVHLFMFGIADLWRTDNALTPGIMVDPDLAGARADDEAIWRALEFERTGPTDDRTLAGARIAIVR